MKAVIGIDLTGECDPALEMFVSLGFPQPEAVLVNAVQPAMLLGSQPGMGAFVPAVGEIDGQEEVAEGALREAARKMEEAGVSARWEVALGSPVGRLLETADREAADLLVVGASGKGTFEAFLLGSASQGLLAESERSVLIGKHAPFGQDSLTAVFATDHSEYANRCADRLLAMAPGRIGRLIVLTANDPDGHASQNLIGGEPAGPLAREAREALEEANGRLCERLAPLGARCEAMVEEGEPEEVIREAVKGSRADLVILGAQGKGFVERLMVGSVAMHQLQNEEHNLLVLRA